MANPVFCLALLFSLGQVLCQDGTTTRPSSSPSTTPSSTEQEQNEGHAYPQQASPEEIKRRLAHLVEEYVDRDKDKQVTVEELRDWLKGIQELMADEEVDRQWAYYSPDEKKEETSWEGYEKPEPKSVLTWEKYRKLTYPEEAMSQIPPPGAPTPKELLDRAERRWKKADKDGDKKLAKEEFKAYLYPEDHEHMKELLVSESTDDMDKDKNEEVSLEEFMEHMKKVSGPEVNDPQWTQVQQNQFTNFLDKNKDGALNAQEMKEWILPPYDRHDAEAWRLMTAADENRDEKLTKDDILKYFQLFMVLQPPEFWVSEASTAKHDEF